jgi:hypothetical protein
MSCEVQLNRLAFYSFALDHSLDNGRKDLDRQAQYFFPRSLWFID